MAQKLPRHRLVSPALITATLLLLSPARSAAADLRLDGHVTGAFATWGPLQVQALSSRDFAIAPLATAPIDATGAFSLRLPPDTRHTYLALWPQTGSAFPILLSELPYSVPRATPLTLPLPPPPQHRAQRQATAAPAFWLTAAALLGGLLLLVLLLRRLFSLTPTVRARPERWLPHPLPSVRGSWPLWLIALGTTALLTYGIFALDEALDLLEYTYFQEAFSGSNPLAVALSPVVAERAHAPGYAVFLWALTKLSHAATILRLPALLATLLGVFVLFRLTADGTQNRPAAWLAALLGTFTPLAMRYARDLTPYSLVGLLALLTTWLLYRALVTGDRRTFALWALTGAAAFFLHYFTAFLILGQVLAGLWIWLRSGRGPFWSARLRQASLAAAALATLPLLWSGQVIRAFVISAQDNLVTHAVYPLSPGFVPYCAHHLRVLFGLPADLAWLAWPLLLLLIWGYVVLLADHPAFGRLLLIPALLIVALLTTTYALHTYAYGGRVYYGWRWLRPYTASVAIPIAYLVATAKGRLPRALAWSGGAVLLATTLYTGTLSALRRERPAQRAAAELLLDNAQDGDLIAVLPAGFYTVGFSYYLHRGAIRAIHSGPTDWEHFKRGDGYVRLFGPIRSFGLPLESLAHHVNLRRLWVAVFDEVIFDQPEFDPALSGHVLAHLDQQLTRLKTYRFPRMSLVLYQRAPDWPWATPIQIDLQHLYRSLRFLPDALDPDRLFQTLGGKRPLRVEVPSPRTAAIQLRLHGVPAGALPTDLRLEYPVKQGPEAGLKPIPLTRHGDTLTGRLPVLRSDTSALFVHRSPAALAWPLVLELSR